jgi:zinc-ribbon domain
MFCRYCGARVEADSLFCSKCGKKLAGAAPEAPGRWQRFKTPWPWAGLVFLVFLTWVLFGGHRPPDLSQVAMDLELVNRSELPDQGLFRHHLSLVVENQGDAPVAEIPVDLAATVTPDQDAEVVAEFRGNSFVILSGGETRPLVLVLADELAVSEKRRFAIDTFVETDPPAEVTYTVVSDPPGEVLATLSVSIPEGDSL